MQQCAGRTCHVTESGRFDASGRLLEGLRRESSEQPFSEKSWLGLFSDAGTLQRGTRVARRRISDNTVYEERATGDFDAEERLHGYGRLERSKTADRKETFVYEGTFLRGLPDGVGRFTSSSGVVYEGEVKEGLKHGTGTLWRRDGSSVSSTEWRRGAIASSTANATTSECPDMGAPKE